MRILLNLALISLGLAAGCAPPEAQFKNRAEVDILYSKAQRELASNLQDHFGTPQQLVAWERLPVEWGGQRGKVVDAAPDAKLDESTFVVSLTAGELPVWPPENLKTGETLEIQFLDGNYAYVSLNDNPKLEPKRILVKSIDPTNNTITIWGRFEEPVLAGSEFVLNPGSTLRYGQQLYMEHCMHCHGVSGDGAGPTAPYLSPPPRDYRKGVYKFTSTLSTDKASRNDLARTVKYGIPGTYMPSFALLKPEELEALVEYVRFLSMRGEYEGKMVTMLKTNAWTAAEVAERRKNEKLTAEAIDAELTEYLRGDFAQILDEDADTLATNWVNAETNPAQVKPLKRQSDLVEGIAAWVESGQLLTGRVAAVTPALAAPAPPEAETPPQPNSGPLEAPVPDETTPAPAEPAPAEPAPAAEQNTSFQVTWSGDAAKVSAGQRILWTTPGLAGVQSEIEQVAGNTLTLKAPLPTPPAAGAAFVAIQGEVPLAVTYALGSGLDLTGLEQAANQSPVALNEFLLQESQKRGGKLFRLATVKCADCHGPLGYGNGRQTEDFEVNKQTGEKYDHPGLHDEWGNIVQPRNLTTNIFRGGRRPIDLYRRIHAGIKGTPMAGFATTLIVPNQHDYQIWDLVNYIYTIPQEDQERQKQLREANAAPVNSSAEPHNATASREN